MSLFIGQSYFKNDGAQFYLILKPILETIKIYAVPSLEDRVAEWISKGMSYENFTPTYTDKRTFLHMWHRMIQK